MTAKWKQIESYTESKSMYESKFNITKKQAQMILDLKKDELKKMRFLAMLDIDKNKTYQTYEGVISFINMFKKEIEIMYLRNILIIKKISE